MILVSLKDVGGDEVAVHPVHYQGTYYHHFFRQCAKQHTKAGRESSFAVRGRTGEAGAFHHTFFFLHTVPLVLPVEPQVCTGRVSAGSNHSERKEKVRTGNFGCRQGPIHSPFQFPSWSRGWI